MIEIEHIACKAN